MRHKHFLDSNLFWTLNAFLFKILFYQIFLDKRIFDPQIFVTNKFQSGVDVDLPLSQQEQEQTPPKSTRMKCKTDLEFGTKT